MTNPVNIKHRELTPADRSQWWHMRHIQDDKILKAFKNYHRLVSKHCQKVNGYPVCKRCPVKDSRRMEMWINTVAKQKRRIAKLEARVK